MQNTCDVLAFDEETPGQPANISNDLIDFNKIAAEGETSPFYKCNLSGNYQEPNLDVETPNIDG